MAVAQSSALYYPFIEIQSEDWLRHAALYWDSVSTIVPESISAPYHSRFSRELADAGVLHPTMVNSRIDEVEGLTDAVLGYLTDPAAANVLLPSASGASRMHIDKLPGEITRLVRVHPEKLPYVLRDQVERRIKGVGSLFLTRVSGIDTRAVCPAAPALQLEILRIMS